MGFQQSKNNTIWVIHAGGAGPSYGPIESRLSFLGDLTSQGATRSSIRDFSFELRFTERGGKAIRGFEDDAVIDVPFELWNIGVNTPDDPSDDFRMIPVICEEGCNAGSDPFSFDIGGDHPVSISSNDPYSDRIYWYNPLDTAPGESGYEAYFSRNPEVLSDQVMRRMVLVLLDGGYERPYEAELPETGTVFRIQGNQTLRPLLASPLDGAVLETASVSFYWSGHDWDSFDLELAGNPAFSGGTLVSSVVPGVSLDVAVDGLYYWRVKSASSGWSNSWSFEVSGLRTGSEQRPEDDLPVRTMLLGSYPNPVRDLGSISYRLAVPSAVKLELFDVLGQKVRVLESGYRTSGNHGVSVDASELGSGVYIYRLRAGEYSGTGQIVVVR